MADAEILDAAVVRTWARLSVEALGRSRAALDGVNVFPVADGDTGTNMHLTLREAAHALHDAPADASGTRLLRLLARGALLGARGNSGVILSEWLRGLAVAATRRDPLAPALDAAARNARLAVAHPEAGTILTAAEVAAAAARHAAASAGVSAAADGGRQAVLDAARRGAREAAISSVGTLAALREAGVLDAGACGLVLVLDALAAAHRAGVGGVMSVAGGSMAPVLDMELHARPAAPAVAPGDGVEHLDGHDAAGDVDELELMFVLRRPAGAAEFVSGGVAEALRADLDVVGRSVVVVGGSLASDGETADGVWQAHVHTDDLDAALGVARRWSARGEISSVHVRHLAAPAAGWGVVAVTAAPALAADLARAGAAVLLDLDARPTSADLAQAALGAGTGKVAVLPGPVGDAASGVPTALAARLDEATEGDDLEVVVLDAHDDMRVVTAAASLAEAQDDAGQDAAAVARAALGRLRAGRADAAAPRSWTAALSTLLASAGEPAVVTALVDVDVPSSVVSDLEALAARAAPDAELVVLPTGQAGTGLVLGVEVAELEMEV